MHYYTFHPAKHKLETYQLKPLERLAYRELMDIYYDTEKPLTTNIDDLAWRMGYETDELKQALKLVLDKFFVIKQLKGDAEPMYHHPRLDRELGLLGRLPWAEWKVIRQRIFDRDNHTCTYCGVTGVALECDHIMPISKGGSNHDDNLTTACEPCNRSKGSKLVGEWK